MKNQQVINELIKILKERYGKDVRIKHLNDKEIFQVLIGTILSQRTRDENSEKAAKNLFSVADTPEKILKLSKKELETLIKPSGPYKQKAKRIKQISKIILEKYKGKVPNSREELMELPSVGFKTSAIVLMYGFGIPAIAVDVHVEQISKRLGLVPQNAKPQEIEVKLEELFPIDKWYIVNLGFVMFGKEICLTRNPRCAICRFNKFCPYGKLVLAKKI